MVRPPMTFGERVTDLLLAALDWAETHPTATAILGLFATFVIAAAIEPHL